MSLSNPNLPVTEQRLQEFYDRIKPYMGGGGGETYTAGDGIDITNGTISTKQSVAGDMDEIIDKLPDGNRVLVTGFTPVGTIISFMGITAPKHYLACDGTVYNIVDYPELASFFEQQFGTKNNFGGDGTTTFAVPNLNGQFLRGTGTNSDTTQGSGAAVGTRQKSTELPESAVINDATSIFLRANSANNGYYGGNYKDSTFKRASGTLKNAMVTTAANTTAATVDTYTVRPTNTSVLYCIATKDIYSNPMNDYSTSEKVVGTWVDGKTLYQKTIHTGALPESEIKSVPHNISNIDTIVDIKGITMTSGYTRPLPKIQDNSTTANCAVQVTTAYIQLLQRGSTTSDFDDSYVTIQYTKTT